MSQIEAALIALIDARIHAAMGNGAQAQPTPTPTPTPTPAHDPFGGLGGTAPQQQATVTPEMIQTLIVPLVANEGTKQRLAAEMQAMGIQNLGDAQPHQLPELYQRFQRVAQEAQGQPQTGGGNAGGGII